VTGQKSEEAERLRAVYSHYESDPATRWKRRPENRGRQAMHQERRRREREILSATGRLPNAHTRILDIGCGRGDELHALVAMGAREENLSGIDLMPNRVETARARLPRAHIQCANAEVIDAPDGAFDLVMLFTVMSSIRDEQMARGLAAEARRVLRPATRGSQGGAILWYDMRFKNPWNPHTVPMKRDRVAALFPELTVQLEPFTVLPQLAQRLGVATPYLYPALAHMPFLLTHYLGLLTWAQRGE
jgi:SAM-dependent methyltransferase